MTQLPNILPAEEFDRGTTTAPPNIRDRMAGIRENAAAHGLDIGHLSRQVQTASSHEALGVLDALHNAAALLFLQWKSAQQTEETETTLAFARLFNGLTYLARDLNTQFALVEDEHLDDLADTLKAGVKKDIDPAYLARALQVAAKAHTHERAWLWVVLPTFARQPYGRILLRKVDLYHCANPIIVTQPFFLTGQSTLFHTHGLNWAISRPLGEGEVRHIHINKLWAPRSPKEPFPLIQIDMAEYRNQDTVGIPPKVIHGISNEERRDRIYSSSVGNTVRCPTQTTVDFPNSIR